MTFKMNSYVIGNCSAVVLIIILPYILSTAIYRLYFHPLRKYPGPRLWAITRIPHAYHYMTGKLPRKLHEIHEKYGLVVRIAPDELNFIEEEAWQDIYGKPPPRNTQLRKDPTQFVIAPDGPMGILVEQDDEVHARLRRNFAPGFSEKALREQETSLNKHFDLLIQRLEENTEKPMDISKWINYITFDIIGDLTFGQSLGCLESGAPQSWLKLMNNAIVGMAVLAILQKFWPLDKLLFALSPQARREESAYRELARSMLTKRLEDPELHPGFLVHAQKNLNQEGGMNFDELAESAGVFIAAGTETTASLITGTIYFLLCNPSVMSKLKHEIRTAFKSDAEIRMGTVNNLEYTLAVLNEALRMYPPVPGNLVRITPSEGCSIAGHFVPGGTCVALNNWSACHSATNFTKPFSFIPERWLGESEFKPDNRKVVQPFSVGPRNCIGRCLAYVEMRVILTRVIWNYDLELCEESKKWAETQRIYFLYDKKPLMVRLKKAKR